MCEFVFCLTPNLNSFILAFVFIQNINRLILLIQFFSFYVKGVLSSISVWFRYVRNWCLELDCNG